MNLNRALEGLLDEMANYSAASLFYQLSGSPDQEITFKRDSVSKSVSVS